LSDGAPKPGPSRSLPRRYPRYPIDVRVSLQVFRAGTTISLWGRSSELGQDGIGATLTGEVEPGEVVTIEVTFPATVYPMKMRAIARYRIGLRHGFEFLALSPAQRETIGHVCEMLSGGI
jgi:PilZ domain